MNILLSLVLTILCISGCGVNQIRPTMESAVENPLEEQMTVETVGDIQQVVLGPGDVLSVTFVETTGLNSRVTVAPDNTIMLPLVGSIQAGGKTLNVLRDELIERYSERLKYPDLIVALETNEKSGVYVTGAVINPGYVPLQGSISVWDAISLAGGFDPDVAQKEKVKVIRLNNEKTEYYQLNFEKFFSGSDNEIMFIEPYDMIYVPEMRIVTVNRWITQYVNNMVPQFIWSLIPFMIFGKYFQ
jgi:protein involved in polysaccharide export with SLBB domain